MRSAATRQDAEATKSKQDCSALRATVTDIRDKIGDVEMKVRVCRACRRARHDTPAAAHSRRFIIIIIIIISLVRTNAA